MAGTGRRLLECDFFKLFSRDGQDVEHPTRVGCSVLLFPTHPSFDSFQVIGIWQHGGIVGKDMDGVGRAEVLDQGNFSVVSVATIAKETWPRCVTRRSTQIWI
jgi:hypothetical protein